MKKQILFILGTFAFISIGMYALYFGFRSKSIKSKLPYFAIDTIQTSIIGTKDTIWQRIPSFVFTNQDGKKIDQNYMAGKIVVADFFFTRCPGICKDMLSQLKRVYDINQSNPNILILSHTVDPEYDQKDVLKAYADQHQIKGNTWQFLTGDKKELYDVARKGYHVVASLGDGGPEDFIHTENFVLIDPNGHIRGYYDGTNPYEVNQLLFDIDVLKSEFGVK